MREVDWLRIARRLQETLDDVDFAADAFGEVLLFRDVPAGLAQLVDEGLDAIEAHHYALGRDLRQEDHARDCSWCAAKVDGDRAA